MQDQSLVETTSIRDRFLADNRRLEALLGQLVAAIPANDRQEMSRLWAAFDSGLLAHMEAEETHLIPELFAVRERDARVLVQEHRHIRARLAELGGAIALHTVRLHSVRDFIDELRAHTHSEDRTLYSWADAHLDERRRAAGIDALAREPEA